MLVYDQHFAFEGLNAISRGCLTGEIIDSIPCHLLDFSGKS